MSGTIVEQKKIRTRLSAQQKLLIVQESFQPGAIIAEVARTHNVGVSSLVKWRKNATEGSLKSMKDDAPSVCAKEHKKLQKELRQLQRLLGKKTQQVEILREAIELAREKKLISQQPLPFEKDTVND
jgi:transposase